MTGRTGPLSVFLFDYQLVELPANMLTPTVCIHGHDHERAPS